MLALALLLAVSTSASPDAAVLASVGSIQITRADLDERLRALAAARQRLEPSAALAGLVEEALLATEARRLGVDREPAVTRDVDQHRRRLAAEAFVARMSPDPDDAALKELFHLTGDSARLVLVKVTTEQEARGVLERVKAGGDLAAEARKSVDPRLAASAGDTGLVTRAALDPALAAEVFRASPGALVGPVALKLGFAVARVVERHVADESGFPARRAAIASFAREQRRGHTRTMVIQQLKKKSDVKLDEDFLRTVGQAGPPTQKDLDHVVARVGRTSLTYRTIHEKLAGSSSAARHGAGKARTSFAWTEIDRLLLEEEALSQGLEKGPAVVAVLPGIERYVLASAAAERIAGRPGADRADPKVRKRVDELRATTKIHVDQAALRGVEGGSTR